MSTDNINDAVPTTPLSFKATTAATNVMQDNHPYLKFCKKLASLLMNKVDDIQQVTKEVQKFITDYSVGSWFDLCILSPNLLPKMPAVKAMRPLWLHQHLHLGNKVKDKTDMRSIIKKLEEHDPKLLEVSHVLLPPPQGLPKQSTAAGATPEHLCKALAASLINPYLGNDEDWKKWRKD